jgi:hypothetical protein
MDILSPTIVEEPIPVNPILVLCNLDMSLLSICCVTDIAFLWSIKTAVYYYIRVTGGHHCYYTPG